MDVSLILPDVPQGVVTFASAVLAALVLVKLTLSTYGFRLLHSIQGRLSELKTGLEFLQKPDISSRVTALLERREQAIREKDTATLVLAGVGIAFTEWQLKEMELREQK